MARLTSEELEGIKKKHNVSRIWSWSRVNTFMTSPYEYMLKYVKRTKEDRQDCAYTTLGTLAHDTLDDFYENKIKYEDMIQQFEDGWVMAIDISDLKLDRNDEEHDVKLKEKYREDLTHFFNNHTIYEHEILIEKPIVAKIGNNVFVGYIDAICKDNDGNYYILDFKTSSIYTGKTFDEHLGQLTIYAIGLNQAGVPLDKIKIGFNFLKYVSVQYEQKNGAVKTRNVERCKLGESLQSNAKMWLKSLGYEDDVDFYLKSLLDLNSIEALPEDVQEKYVITDCHVYADLDDALINKWTDIIGETIKDISLREKDYKETNSDKCFWDTDDNVKKQSYYFASLCSYSPSVHKPYAEYLDKLESKKNNISVFDGVGKDCQYDVISTNNDVDLSWLNDL